ncbi:hypothetical protein [Paenibacillus sp. 22594]|uniref:hypothetical protein n=1 Tax=Paenibacillus sp. 22594 TaxID=3453947 RepID=UPI003F836A72
MLSRVTASVSLQTEIWTNARSLLSPAKVPFEGNPGSGHEPSAAATRTKFSHNIVSASPWFFAA